MSNSNIISGIPNPSIPRITIFVNTAINPPTLEVESNLTESIQIILLLSQAISLMATDLEKKKLDKQIVVPIMSVPNVPAQ